MNKIAVLGLGLLLSTFSVAGEYCFEAEYTLSVILEDDQADKVPTKEIHEVINCVAYNDYFKTVEGLEVLNEGLFVLLERYPLQVMLEYGNADENTKKIILKHLSEPVHDEIRVKEAVYAAAAVNPAPGSTLRDVFDEFYEVLKQYL